MDSPFTASILKNELQACSAVPVSLGTKCGSRGKAPS